MGELGVVIVSFPTFVPEFINDVVAAAMAAMAFSPLPVSAAPGGLNPTAS